MLPNNNNVVCRKAVPFGAAFQRGAETPQRLSGLFNVRTYVLTTTGTPGHGNRRHAIDRDRLDILAQEIRQSRVLRTETEPVRNDSSRCVAGNPIAWAAARVEFRHGLDEARSFSRKG